MSEHPKGIVCLITDKNGREMAAATDFDTSGYGGFTLQEAQTIRAKDAVYRKLIHNLCSADMANAIGSHYSQQIFQQMQHTAGYTLHTIKIGYED